MLQAISAFYVPFTSFSKKIKPKKHFKFRVCVTFKCAVSFTITIFLIFFYICVYSLLSQSVREWSYVTISARQRNAACNYSLSINLFYLYIYIFIVSYRIV